MKKLMTHILFFCLTILSVAQGGSNVSITVNKSDAMIFVNDEYIDEGETGLILEQGVHVISIYERGRGWDSKVIIDTVLIDDTKSSFNLSYEIKSKLKINSYPQDARIYSNNALIGRTPFLVSDKYSEVDVKKKNYESILNLDLTSSKAAPIELHFTGKKEEENFAESTLFKVLIGSAVALGATAAYLKIQADQRFEEYNKTNDRDILDEVDSYDLYSGVSFGLLQINLGYLIYRFIFDHQ